MTFTLEVHIDTVLFFFQISRKMTKEIKGFFFTRFPPTFLCSDVQRTARLMFHWKIIDI